MTKNVCPNSARQPFLVAFFIGNPCRIHFPLTNTETISQQFDVCEFFVTTHPLAPSPLRREGGKLIYPLSLFAQREGVGGEFFKETLFGDVLW
jgi:hypothetical protein